MKCLSYHKEYFRQCKKVLFVCHLYVIISKFFLEYPKMSTLGLDHDDLNRSEILIINHYTTKELVFILDYPI